VQPALGAHPAKAQPGLPCTHASQPALALALDSIERARCLAAALRCAAPFFSFFLYLFLLNKYCLIFINSHNQ
jgi:hypothetical protein